MHVISDCNEVYMYFCIESQTILSPKHILNIFIIKFASCKLLGIYTVWQQHQKQQQGYGK